MKEQDRDKIQYKGLSGRDLVNDPIVPLTGAITKAKFLKRLRDVVEKY